MIATLGREAALRLMVRAVDSGVAGPRAADASQLLADRRLLSFARGFSIGALLGAALAGLGIWSRIRSRRV